MQLAYSTIPIGSNGGDSHNMGHASANNYSHVEARPTLLHDRHVPVTLPKRLRLQRPQRRRDGPDPTQKITRSRAQSDLVTKTAAGCSKRRPQQEQGRAATTGALGARFSAVGCYIRAVSAKKQQLRAQACCYKKKGRSLVSIDVRTRSPALRYAPLQRRAALYLPLYAVAAFCGQQQEQPKYPIEIIDGCLPNSVVSWSVLLVALRLPKCSDGSVQSLARRAHFGTSGMNRGEISSSEECRLEARDGLVEKCEQVSMSDYSVTG
jgi:hypothetical protein